MIGNLQDSVQRGEAFARLIPYKPTDDKAKGSAEDRERQKPSK